MKARHQTNTICGLHMLLRDKKTRPSTAEESSSGGAQNIFTWKVR